MTAPLVVADPTGPTYPPPGGVTLGSSGTMGRAGGLTWTYADIDMGRFNGIWWGPWAGDSFRFAFDGAIDEPGETLVFDFGSNTAGGVAQWLGSSDLRHFSGGVWVTERLETRLTIRPSLMDATPIAFLDPTTIGLDGDLAAVIAVPGNYQANFILEAKRGAAWQPVLALYDSLHTDPACDRCAVTSVGAGFYVDLNRAPIANFTWTGTPVELEPVTFTSTSSDPEGRPMTLAWDLDADGEFDDATGPEATRTFPAPGTYSVGIRATDDRGLTSTSVREVVVDDCSKGPVSDVLRNTVHPAAAGVAPSTTFVLACTVGEETGL